MNISVSDYVCSSVAFNTRVINHMRKLSKFAYNWYMFIPFAAFGKGVTFKLKDGTSRKVNSYPEYFILCTTA